jgi:hypothetical protein
MNTRMLGIANYLQPNNYSYRSIIGVVLSAAVTWFVIVRRG